MGLTRLLSSRFRVRHGQFGANRIIWAVLTQRRLIASVVPELDEYGNVEKVMGWLLDISERKYHENKNIQRLKEEQAERRFARLAETAPMV